MSSTQIFGGGRSPMASTQIFGSGPHPKPSMDGTVPEPAPVPNTTQTFGAVPPARAAEGAVPPPPQVAPVGVTRAFGAVPAQAASAPGNATQTFGAVPAQQGAPSPGNATQTFGAVPPAQQGAPSPGNATQTFGAVPAQGSTSPGNATQTFGAVPAHGSTPPGNTTQTFGAVAPRGPAPQGHTQAFGAVPAQDAPAQVGRTQTFGAVPAPVGSERVIGVPPVPSQAAGTPSVSSGIFPARTSATPSAHSQGAVATTQSYGAVSAEPPPGAPSQGSNIGRTALFGAASATPGQDAGIRLPPEPVGSETLLPFGPTTKSGALEPVSGTAGTLRRPSVELPPELLAASRASSSSAGLDSSRPAAGRERLVLPLVLVAGLVLAAVLAYPAWRDRDSDMPAAAVEDKDRAAALLRRDDLASREQAIQRLRTLNAAHPRYTEAQAELAVALSLRLSDLQAELEQLRLRSDKLNREKDAARDHIASEARQRRVDSLDKQLQELAGQMAPLRSEVDSLRQALDKQIAVLAPAPDVEPAPALVARLKARAIHAGVTVSPDALALAERLRNAEGASKSWSTLARVEYALSANSPPDSLMGVSKELAVLRKDDSTLLRAYVLGARVALRLNDPDTARSLLDDALALNPNHQLASRLLAGLNASARP